jgi:hypothetical protein
MFFCEYSCLYRSITSLVLSLFVSNVVVADIIVRHNPPVNIIEQALLDDMQESNVIQRSLAVLQKTIPFSDDLTIVYGETPSNAIRPGPYYSMGKISIPYRYVFQIRKYLNKRKHIHRYKDVNELVFASLVFALLHEAGHALIDQHHIPIFGREEDVVDNFASYILLTHFADGRDLVQAAAVVFDLQSRTGKKITDKEMQGEHRLNKQRYFSLLCSLHGHQPKVTPVGFSQRRAARCVGEYRQLHLAWGQLLSSLLR